MISSRHRVGVASWWTVAVVVAPVAAVVTAVSFLGVSGSCYPGPTTTGCLSWGSIAFGVVVAVTVVAGLLAGASLLARGGARPSPATRMLRAHLTLVMVLSAAFLTAMVATHVDDHGSVGSSVMLGVGGIPLMGLGAPWTVVREYLLPDHGSELLEALAETVLVLGPALLNVAVHAGILRLVRRRTAGRNPHPAPSARVPR